LSGLLIGAFAWGFVDKATITEAELRRRAEAAAASSEKIRQEDAAREKRRAEEQRQWRQELEQCRTARICRKYATVRQECAIAGNFKNCVQVKMNVDYSLLQASCRDDGTLASEQPNTIACFFKMMVPD